MDFQLQPITESGKRLVALSEQHATDFATRAEQHDREGSFPFENITALQDSGVMAACVPRDLGGFGVDSVHDLTVSINRLARGDGSTAIAANMHLGVSWLLARQWNVLHAKGDVQAADSLGNLLQAISARQLILSNPASEAGTDFLHGLTTATKTDGGWLLNGRKIFGTLSPVGQLFAVSARMPGPNGEDRLGFAFIPRETQGLEIKDNWDALGMRASGSHDVVLKDCFVSGGMLRDIGPWGCWSTGLLVNRATGNVPLLGAFVGIAEAARDLIIAAVKMQRRAPSNRPIAERYSIQHTIAEIEIDLAAIRAVLERTCLRMDAFHTQYAGSEPPMAEAYEFMKDFQCTKWLVNRKAIEIVDRALTASGGSGYLSKNPLSRLYRDVRAGPFMQPLSPNEAFEYIGKVTLGLDPNTET
jgi:alkylation response protein AidB-like acyl-CoA dehydrogenase